MLTPYRSFDHLHRHFLDVLVACERSGIWADAFAAWGCSVTQVDLALPPGLHCRNNVHVAGADVRPYLRETWDIVVAFPPCTDIAKAGAHLWKDVYPSLQLLLACAECACRAKIGGLVENPAGLAKRVLGDPQVRCDPWEWATEPHENKKKYTCLWTWNWPEPMRVWSGSASARSFIDLVPAGGKQAEIRSQGWQGMANAFVRALMMSKGYSQP